MLRVEIAEEGVDYSLKRLYRIVKELGYRLIKPRRYRVEEHRWVDFKKVEELMSGCFNVLFIDESRRALIWSWEGF